MREASVTIGGRRFHLLYPDLLRTLTERERQDLKNSIRKHGVKVAVVVDENDGIIDGGHRASLAAEVGLQNIPLDVRRGLADWQKLELALTLNADRRQLTPAERKQLKEERVKRVAEARARGESTRTIAEREGVSQPQVVRDIKEAGDTSVSPALSENKIEGQDGKIYPAHRNPAGNEKPPTKVEIYPVPRLPDTGLETPAMKDAAEIPAEVRPEVLDAFMELWGRLNASEKAFLCRFITNGGSQH